MNARDPSLPAHAELGASSAHRWMVCPGSVRLCRDLPDSPSPYAAEGTLAHGLAETCLRSRLSSAEVHAAGGDRYPASMVAPVQTYLDYCNALPGHAFIEMRVDFSLWVPGGFGTSDFVAISDGVLTVVDLKFGSGVRVDAQDNPQLMLYALGAYGELGDFYAVDWIKTVIVQPNLDHISEAEYSTDDLMAFGSQVAAAARRTQDPDAPCVVDTKACRFCKAAAICRARAEANLEAARIDFQAETLSPEELAAVVGQAKQIRDWLTAVEAHAFTLAEAGKLPGFKVVEGRANRVISRQDDAALILVGNGYSREQIYKPAALRGITELEKLVGKQRFAELLSGCITKPAGAPTLAPEADPRPAYSTAAADFKP